MRTDFENINDGEGVILYPDLSNPLHKYPVDAMFSGGYFYCKGTDPKYGPDYYYGDILQFVQGFDTKDLNETNGLVKDDCKEVEDLKSLCSDLLKGMDKCSEAPYYIVQPFLSIIKKHKDTIKKYNID